VCSITTVQARTAPVLVVQPQSQVADVGGNITFSATVAASASLPAVGSGTLQVWLKADAGVVTNGAGLVSQWQDQSSNSNNAAQASTSLQPSLVFPAGLGGKPALRFNGIQNNINGSYLFGPGLVNVPNAMTAFTVYNAFSATNAENIIWDLGIPDVFGGNRVAMIAAGDMHFSFWSYDWSAPFIVPTNTYRLRTDRLDTNLDTLNMFDATASSQTNFTISVNGGITPEPGYYLGGINSSVGPYVGSSRNFYGDIAEMICYSGYLTEADRQAVATYLEEKYEFIGTTNGVAFQWQFDGTNIDGATNATLTLTDVQTNQAGSYSVIVTNLAGSETSSNAVLTVGYSPVIVTEPQSQEVVQGSNILFTVGVNGTGPLSYQWYFDGLVLDEATNSTLSLTNVQGTNSGSYSVSVSSPFGSIASSDATLTVNLFPVIMAQPQSQVAVAGTNVTFSVTVAGSASLPAVGSGTLQLWLKADAGVVTSGAGLVSQWEDQSGNSNNAAQANTNLQPSMAFDAGLGGKPVVRFNGIHDNINGSYLFGPGVVNVPNAMTAFTVYDAFSATNAENIIWEIGVPADAGSDRVAMITYGDLHFSFWSYDWSAPFIVPTNTYRLRTDRLDTNLDTLNMYDATASSQTNFTISVGGGNTPEAGYYLGGVNSSAGPYVGSSRNFYGDIAEVLVYQGYLTDADRLAVTSYLEEKYQFTGVTNGVTYQWQFDGANIIGATNAVLTLTDVQANQTGTYTVVLTDSAGSVTSSNAVLNVGYSPMIVTEPQSQEVVQGSNVLFTVVAGGSAPLSFQWYFDGAPLAQATNSTFALTNVQGTNSGAYSVSVSNLFGSALSSNAALTVDFLPVILGQPQSQDAVTGTSITFSVAANDGVLSSIRSGSLQLWLAADAGVITNGSGLVSQWLDQSANSNNAAQANTNLEPSLAFAQGLSGRPVVRFNGIQNNINGSYLFGSAPVNVPNAMTAFTIYNAFSAANTENVIWDIGIPDEFGRNRIAMITEGDLHFSFWSYDWSAPFVVPTNTYRLRIDCLDTNLDTLEMFDATASSQTNFIISVDGGITPEAGYYLGGLNTSVGPYVGSSRNFDGDIAEMVCYSGYLTESDRQEVATYLEEKYFQNNSFGAVTYQWQFDGTNIFGATNATLTLTDIQTNQAGTYSVIVTDSASSVTSSNAILTTLSPPMITASPTGQSVNAGASVTFTGSATGTAPLSFQWQFDGTNIFGATNTSLTLSDVVVANAGSYWMVASNPYGSATSSAAILSVDETTIQVISTNGVGGTNVVVSIDVNALGTEAAIGFTLNFDPTVLVFQGVALGSGAAGGAMQVNSNEVASGSLGILFGGTFSPGTNDAFDVTFEVLPVTNATTTILSFGNQPTTELVSDSQAHALPAVFVPGNVVIPVTSLAGDVSPRPNGNEILNVLDWVQEGRFVAGLDTVSNGSEFQRADCAPRGDPDGQITVADWVQVGRYVAGLDPLTAAGGPTSPASPGRVVEPPVKTDLPRPVMFVPLAQGGLTNIVAVEMVTQGDESSLGFSVNFDPAVMRFINAEAGAGATGATLIQNTNTATSGQLGFVVGLLAPGKFAAGTLALVNLHFASINYSNNAALSFADNLVLRQLADSQANILPVNFQNGTLAVGGATWPALAVAQTAGNIVFSWPAASAGFTLQAAPSLAGAWTNVTEIPTTNGDDLVITAPVSTNSQYFRLKY
jgi:hypothetical protein